MQAKSKILVFLVAMLSALLLSACGGGTTGKTLFNVPSIPLKVNADGTASLFGLGLPPVVDPAMVQQLQGAGIQQLEVRPGYNGIHVYNNGQDLPYIKWDADSVGTLGEVLTNLPADMTGGADMNAIAQAIPALRQIGLGVKLNVPPADGAEVLAIAPWRGETTATVSDAAPEQSMKIGSLAFTPDGAASVAGVPLSDLGVSGVAIPAGIMGALAAVGADKLGVTTGANGIDLSLGGKKLPSIAFDGDSLAGVIDVAAPFIGDEATLNTIKSAVPTLQTTALDLDVSLTGEAGETDLGSIPLALNADGTLSAMGFPTGQTVLDAEMLGQLQAAGIQQLDVNLNADSGLQLGANGMSLPSLSWTGDSLDKIINGVVIPMTGANAEQINGGLAIFDNIAGESGFSTSLSIPNADGSTAESVDAVLGSYAAADPNAPTGTIRMVANYAGGQLQDISGTDLGAFAEMIPALPPQVADMMSQLGASALQIKSEANKLNILADGENLLTLDYDATSLNTMLDLAAPFLADTPLADANVMAFVQNTIVPSLPGSDLDITLNVE